MRRHITIAPEEICYIGRNLNQLENSERSIASKMYWKYTKILRLVCQTRHIFWNAVATRDNGLLYGTREDQ
jgi:hypothetical protein